MYDILSIICITKSIKYYKYLQSFVIHSIFYNPKLLVLQLLEEYTEKIHISYFLLPQISSNANPQFFLRTPIVEVLIELLLFQFFLFFLTYLYYFLICLFASSQTAQQRGAAAAVSRGKRMMICRRLFHHSLGARRRPLFIFPFTRQNLCNCPSIKAGILDF